MPYGKERQRIYPNSMKNGNTREPLAIAAGKRYHKIIYKSCTNML